MSSPSRDVKPDVEELEQASQEAPATPLRPEKLNLTLSYGDQRESVYTSFQLSSSFGHSPKELRFALKPTAKVTRPLHFRSLADGVFV